MKCQDLKIFVMIRKLAIFRYHILDFTLQHLKNPRPFFLNIPQGGDSGDLRSGRSSRGGTNSEGENLLLVDLHPGRLTWNLKMMVWKVIFLFNWVIFRFHVDLSWCMQRITYPSWKLTCPLPRLLEK